MQKTMHLARKIPLFLVLLFLLTLIPTTAQQGEVPGFDLTDAASYRVIVSLNTVYQPEARYSDENAALMQRSAIQRTQNDVLNGLSGVSSITRYETLPYIALEVDADGLRALQANPAVLAIYEDAQFTLQSTDADISAGVIGAIDARNLGFGGQNQVIAVLDAGMDFSHPALQGKAVAEACFNSTSSLSGTTTTCLNGQDTQIGSGASLPNFPGGLSAANNQGQAIGGIVAGNDNQSGGFRGIAPDAKLVSANVFSRVINPGGGTSVTSFYSDVIQAMEWVYANRDFYRADAIVLSLSSTTLFSNQDACNADPNNAPLRTAIQQLREAEIAVIAGSGDQSSKESMSAPACIAEVISVGGVEVGEKFSNLVTDRISAFSNSVGFLDLLAPGYPVFTSILVPNNDNQIYDYKSGTGMAAANVAGAWAILSQAYPNATNDEKLLALKETGSKLTDSNNVITSRIQIDAALNRELTTPILQFPTNSGNSGVILKFQWGRVAYAWRYHVRVLDSNSAVVFDQIVAPQCNINNCSYTPGINLNIASTYQWNVAAVSPLGTESAPSSTGTFIADATISDVPADLIVTGLTNTAPVRPTFFWTHKTSQNATTVPGEWYNVSVTQGGIPLMETEWFPVHQVCSGVRCEFTPDRDDFLIGLGNGTTTWRVRAWDIDNGFGDWSSSSLITVEMSEPQLPANVRVQATSGRPIMTWNHDPNASWFNVWVGTPAPEYEAVSFDWYEKTDIICGGLTCTLAPDAHPPSNGTYELWVRSWGPEGFSTGGSFEGWAGPYAFSVTNSQPNVIDALTTTHTNSGRPTVGWNPVNGATWYHVQFLDSSDAVVYSNWYAALEIGCDTTCQVATSAILENNQTYSGRMQAWGPGGFNSGSATTFVNGADFTVDAASAAAPTGLTPTGTINTAAPVFSWNAVTDASWYELLVDPAPNAQTELNPAHQQWYPAEQLGCTGGGICSIQVNDLYLTNGGHSFRVRAYTPAGVGNFSADAGFTISGRP